MSKINAHVMFIFFKPVPEEPSFTKLYILLREKCPNYF